MSGIERTLSLPKELNRARAGKAFFGCAYALTLMIGSAVALGFLWSSAAPLWAKILGALVFGVTSGYGQLLAGFMGHDGTHFNLHSNKVVSCLMGIVVTSPIFPYLLMGFTISHWNHHKYTNTAKDPDSRIFSRFESFASRALFARPFTFLVYGNQCLRLAFNLTMPFEYQFPLAKDVVRKLALFNIAMNVVSAVIVFTFCLSFPIYGAAVLCCYAFGSVLSGLSPFIEHTGTGMGRGIDTRTSVGAWWDFFLLGNNYHLEHHLYPTVPFYNLKGVYGYLKDHGYYEKPRFVSSGIWDTYRYTKKRYPYPTTPR